MFKLVVRATSVLVISGLLLLPLKLAAEEVLTVAFNHKPPFFSVENGQATGLVVDRAREILDRAGVAYRFEELPFLRIMNYLETGKPMFAALGFSKTPERERFAAFSLPIYRDQSPRLIIRPQDRAAFESFKSLAELATQSSFRFCGKQGNAYPIDPILQKMAERGVRFAVEATRLPVLLSAGRCDFSLSFPEELPYMYTLNGYTERQFVQITYPDLPAGGDRYFLFSQSVPLPLIGRINSAIKH